jgi:hypothetical protein
MKNVKSTDYQGPSKCLGRVATETSHNVHACPMAILVLGGAFTAFTASVTLVTGTESTGDFVFQVFFLV